MAAVLGPVLAAVFVAELATEGYWRAPSPKPSPESPERPVADRTGSASASAESGGTRAPTPAEETSREPESKPTPDDDAPKPTDPADPSPDEPRAPAPGGAPTRAPDPTHSAPPSPAAPTPDPSPTCTRFLWWCA